MADSFRRPDALDRPSMNRLSKVTALQQQTRRPCGDVEDKHMRKTSPEGV
ncbi:MAG TPA: hypothetical protein VFO41_06785 [Alphaproteobacteria bacterium]|nr:hypothetical protein [Alphaproteobacteria bacterium]